MDWSGFFWGLLGIVMIIGALWIMWRFQGPRDEARAHQGAKKVRKATEFDPQEYAPAEVLRGNDLLNQELEELRGAIIRAAAVGAGMEKLIKTVEKEKKKVQLSPLYDDYPELRDVILKDLDRIIQEQIDTRARQEREIDLLERFK